MKNAVKRGLCLAVSTLLILCLSACGEQEDKFPKATENFFVNDFADAISDTDETEIYSRGVALQNSTTAQAVVVTVETTDGMEIAEYALEIGRAWGVGDAEKDNGIVVVLATRDREVYVAVGYGLEGALPDSKTGRILDVYGMPYFENDNFSTGLSAVYKALVNEVYIEYGIETEEDYTPIALIPQYDFEGEIGSEALKVGVSWLILIVIIALYLGIFGRRGAFIFFGGPPTHFGGHFGGGFKGGGFGGFKGGGGSFGGGGAGRGF